MRKKNLKRIFLLMMIILIIFFCGWLFLFLHKNFYQSIIQAQEIEFLKKEMVEEGINVPLINKIIQKIEIKKSISFPKNFKKTKNPFSFYSN
ncbi:MAG: hypothetical protein AAB526_03685 [Patescibacteria group bacterium]